MSSQHEDQKLKDRLARLSPEKRRVFEELLRKKAASAQKPAAGEPPPLERVARDTADGVSRPLPVSFSQQRLWLLYQLEPESSAYNLPTAVRVRGRLDPTVLRRALEALLARHEVLRTAFVEIGGEPRQVVEADPGLPWVWIDLSRLEAPRSRELLRTLAGREARDPFELESAPLLRARWVQLAAEEGALLLNFHHIASDGWSRDVLVRETVTFYAAFAQGRPAPLPELPIQYADYAVWQRKWLSGEVLERHLEYWRHQLAALPTLELPTDRPRPPVQSYRGSQLRRRLSTATVEPARELARREGASPFMVLLAAFQVLLARLSGQGDVVVGSPIANRTSSEIEGLIGFFVNTLVLRTDLGGVGDFRSAVAHTRETALGAYAHQALPFERLVEELQPERDLSRNPLFQVLFNLVNTPTTRPALEFSGLVMEPLGNEATATQFDLGLVLNEAGDGSLGAGWDFATDLFDPTTVERMARSFELLLEGAARQPEADWGRLPLLSAAEEHQLECEWNDTPEPYPGAASTLDGLVAQRSAERPEAVAAVAGTSALSHGELERRAAALGVELARRGVGPESLVALALERSLEMVVAVLGVLRAGGAYLPLDPELPEERLSFILEDASPALVLTAGEIDWLPAGLSMIDLSGWHPDPASERLAGTVLTTGSRATDGERAAYAIYTSGTTGRPKGVLNRHPAILNRLLWMQAEHPIGPGDRLLQKTPLFFDASIWELFLPLMTGAELELARPGGHADGDYLAEAIATRRVTVLQLVPSMLEVFAATPGARDCESLRRLFCGGEAYPRELARRTRELLPGTTVHNLYGPTEASIDVASWTPRGDEDPGALPIGRPLRNVSIHVLDRGFRPVPIGVAGELVAGGINLARGYLRRPALTAERFVPDEYGIPDPFAEEPGQRLYRTGDLVRRRADGRLIFLGRLDHQVKLRGLRIELGEIETALARHPEIRQAVALLRQDGPGAGQLVAYVVLESVVPDGAEPTSAELRRELAEQLPQYMVPSAFVFLDELPTLPNGKVDRKALPAPEAARPGGGTPPRTLGEELLAEIWAEVLGDEAAAAGGLQIGAHDDFFDLGGHSLLATRVLSRVRVVFGVELPLRSVFEHSTLAELAAAIETARAEGGAAAPPIEPVVRGGDLPPSFAQERMWFLQRLEPRSFAYNLPVALRFRGALDLAALEAAVGAVVERHAALRAVFRHVEGEPVQQISEPAPVPLPVVDLAALADAESEARRLAAFEARKVFDLARGPLFRATLLRLSPEDHVGLWTLHHIASDDWSTGILVREITALYRAVLEGTSSPLPPLPVQYSDFAVWQRTWLSGEVLEAELDFWRGRLDPEPPPLELPTDRPRPAVQSFHGAARGFVFTEEESAAVRRLARGRGATPFMVLAAAFAAQLGRWAGQDDFALGTPVAGRHRVEIEGLIGFFANTLALRLGPRDDTSFVRLLGEVREAALEAHAHQDLPFEKLVEELQPERSLARPPIFQVAFVLQNAPREALELPGLALEPFGGGDGGAKFELTLTIHEGEVFAGVLEWNVDLFDETTARRISSQYRRLLASALEDPERQLGELEILSLSERHQLVREWNAAAEPAGAVSGDGSVSVTELVARRARSAPEAPAVVWEGGSWSYGELHARAGVLAAELRRRGVGPEVRVALLLERSPEWVAAALAVLQAGGAYLPLDPAYPRERQVYTLCDARPAVLISRGPLAEGLGAEDVEILDLDTGDFDTGDFDTGDFDTGDFDTEPDQAAYVIYTSGSTGRPKGAVLCHRGLSNLAAWHAETYRVGPGERLTHLASSGFDAAVFEIWPPLAAGAALHLPSAEALASPTRLLAYYAEEGITVSYLPTPLAEAVLAETPPEGLELRLLLTAGDRLRRAPSEGLPFTLVNLYGPTEATVATTATEVSPGLESAPPIGRPLPRIRALVLDRAGRPVPIGAPGELTIGGIVLARGYFERPALTAQAFVPDGLGDTPGARLYRTGDLVRVRAEGLIDFLGRRDHQVKVRGFRIELGEIEAALAGLATVRETAVVAAVTATGERRLVAFAVPAGAKDGIDAEHVRRELAQSLPEHMVPSAIVVRDELPLTVHGKLDRRELERAARDEVQSGARAPYTAPRDDLEEVLAAMWGEVLGVERVGVDDDFFELGGHSVLAMRLVARLEDTFRFELPLKDLFQAGTVARLAEVMKEREPRPGQCSKVAAVLLKVKSMSVEEKAARLVRQS